MVSKSPSLFDFCTNTHFSLEIAEVKEENREKDDDTGSVRTITLSTDSESNVSFDDEEQQQQQQPQTMAPSTYESDETQELIELGGESDDEDDDDDDEEEDQIIVFKDVDREELRTLIRKKRYFDDDDTEDDDEVVNKKERVNSKIVLQLFTIFFFVVNADQMWPIRSRWSFIVYAEVRFKLTEDGTEFTAPANGRRFQFIRFVRLFHATLSQ